MRIANNNNSVLLALRGFLCTLPSLSPPLPKKGEGAKRWCLPLTSTPRMTPEAKEGLHPPSSQRAPLTPGGQRQAPVSGSQVPPF